MSSEELFIQYQPQLQRIAYNMVGCWRDAEDLVQDTFEKWLKVDHTAVKNAPAYLIQILRNVCLNFLNSFRKRHETLSPHPHETLNQSHVPPHFEQLDFEREISFGLSELLQKLTSPELSVLLLKDGFGMDYKELSVIFEKRIDHCRQLFSRAKGKLKRPVLRFKINPEKKRNLVQEINSACSNGNLQPLITLLQKEHLQTL